MKDQTLSHIDQSKWSAYLVQSVSDDEIPDLCNHVHAALHPADHADVSFSPPRSNPARLLALYIARAGEQHRATSGATSGMTRQKAHAALTSLSRQLADRAATPKPEPKPEPEPEPVIRAPEPQPEPNPEPAPEPAPAPEPKPAPTPEAGAKLAEAIRLAYHLILKRAAVEEEVQIWLRNFHNGVTFQEFLLGLYGGTEALARRAAQEIDPGVTDGDFIVDLFRVIHGRGCSAHEIDLLRQRLETHSATRQDLLNEAFAAIAARERADEAPLLHDGLSTTLMGTGEVVTVQDWHDKARDAATLARARSDLRPVAPFVWAAEPGIRVSALASLYCGGDFIEQFMDNITGQTGFDRHCELIIIDADSPENEGDTIRRYLDRHPSVVYRRMNSRIGIYEAWNVGVEMARGRYLTNTNLDDLRRADSLEIQAGALDALPFADVVYQDFYTTFDPALSWEEVAAFGYKSDLPILTPHNMLHFNSPHNAPMWRKALHDELGLFDASFKSAGDFEFWMRCLSAGKTFYKINEPHVVYYQNPQGLSTKADSRGLLESHAITRKYGPGLMPAAMTRDFDGFLADIGTPDAPSGDRNRYLATQKSLRNLARNFKGAI